ncbi:hypothetical protein K32_48450 [Kaistia sp. 32K]|uniref:hypothetical protein n=1 Tax=Kaistia sp. 32K TaxID=2795690 RepID=UPI001915F022|nr:hypothetical protein [Kaistia sp. 32K]BCP56228.1 hypothetical protein K32_48450 [Kaistia sp. 32K]
MAEQVKRVPTSVLTGLIDVAHERRHELICQQFPDNDEGDALCRVRDRRVGRIDRLIELVEREAVVCNYDALAAEVERLKSTIDGMNAKHWELVNAHASLRAKLAERDAHPVRALGQEAYSTLVGMVEFCLERRVRMGMDEGFKSFEPEDEHDFVKELRGFVALAAHRQANPNGS